MKLSQLKHWLKSSEGQIPKCVLTSYAGQTGYLMEIEYKHQLVPLKDNQDKMLNFQSIEHVKSLLRPLGITSIVLRIIDPYDEFSLDGKVSTCREDMIISL